MFFRETVLKSAASQLEHSKLKRTNVLFSETVHDIKCCFAAGASAASLLEQLKVLLLSWSKCCFTAGAILTKTHLSENIQKSERFWPGPFEVSRFPFSLTPHTYTKSCTRHFEPSRFPFSSKLLSHKQTPTKPPYRSTKLSYEPDRNH